MIFVSLLGVTGLTFVISGLFLLKKPPKKINWWYGYRTSNTMKNQQIWDYSQQIGGRYMSRFGGILIIIGLLGFLLPLSPAWAAWISIIILMVGLGITLYLLDVKVKAALEQQSGK